jgi:hypothetical protein
MTKKERERDHLVAVAEVLGEPRLIDAKDHEEPDFLLVGCPTIGIEITEFHDLSNRGATNRAREQSSLRDRTVLLAKQHYAQLSPDLPRHVTITFHDWPPLTKARPLVLAETIAWILSSLRKDFIQIANYGMLGVEPCAQRAGSESDNRRESPQFS